MTDEDPDELVRLSGEIIQAGSKSFAAAARLFDPQTRASAYLLYAWCRHCDDVIDGQALGFRSGDGAAPHDPHQALETLRKLTGDALDGKPMADPVFAAFQRVALKHALPRRHPLELLDGFAMEVAERRYETIEDTLSYCYHVAGVVGVMMAIIMGAQDEETLDRASDLGLAFQLTNIVRDIVDDASVGRLYLPRQWLHEAGIPPELVAHKNHRPALFDVARRMLGIAEMYYDSSQAGIAQLPVLSAWAVATARVVYREIGREVTRRGPQAWDRRVSTSKRQKVGAILSGGGTAVTAGMFARLATPKHRQGLWTRPKA
jgi:15-cis-phytoene synthase